MKTDHFVRILRERGIVPRTIYDVGSFDGQQAIELAHAFPQAQVYAFEPVPANVVQCLRNTEGEPRITVFPCAVGSKSGWEPLYETTNNAEAGSLLPPNGVFYRAKPRKLIVRLEAIGNVIPIPMPDVIWMDTQGSEIDVLLGMGATILFLRAFWAELHYQECYVGQMLAPEFNARVKAMGFEMVFEERAPQGWFGDGMYVRV